MQITKQIHAIKIPFQIPVAPGKTLDRFVYSYLIYDTEICLIDSGIKSSERGGVIKVRVKTDRVILSGQAVTVINGEILYK